MNDRGKPEPRKTYSLTGMGASIAKGNTRAESEVKQEALPASHKSTDLEYSTFQRLPAYRYIRASDKLPALFPEEDTTIARIKLFDPTGSWTWYLAAYDPDTRQAYGLVDGHEKEYGYIDMAELVAFRGSLGLPIERDLHWERRPLSELA